MRPPFQVSCLGRFPRIIITYRGILRSPAVTLPPPPPSQSVALDQEESRQGAGAVAIAATPCVHRPVNCVCLKLSAVAGGRPLRAQYEGMVAAGTLRPDDQQAAVVDQLDTLLTELRAYGRAVKAYRGSVQAYPVRSGRGGRGSGGRHGLNRF